MANGGSIGSSIGMDVENIGSGIIALEELGSLAQRVGDQAVEALGNISVDVLVTAITEVTVALENLTSTLQDSTNCGTIYEEIALGISSLSLACDLFTGEKVRRFIVDEALDLKTVTVELANCSAAWVKNTAVDVWKIPYLAQGAVLPANRPFLAVVGDQKHGANVEAPLETIQEAVALVMGDVVASNMAGHEATVGVLREILDAVLGIEIGDEVIGRAAARYGSRMAVVRGVR